MNLLAVYLSLHICWNLKLWKPTLIILLLRIFSLRDCLPFALFVCSFSPSPGVVDANRNCTILQGLILSFFWLRLNPLLFERNFQIVLVWIYLWKHDVRTPYMYASRSFDWKLVHSFDENLRRCNICVWCYLLNWNVYWQLYSFITYLPGSFDS